MTELQVSADVETQDGSTPESQEQRTDLKTLPVDVQDYIKELRQEAKKYNDQKKAALAEKDQQERARLEQEKQWETLAQKYKSDLDSLSPKAERLDAMEQFLKESAQKRIDGLPKQYRSLVPDYDDPLKTLAWLDANAAALALPVPPNLNPGAQGDQQTAAPKADQEAIDNARRMGMNETDLAALKMFLANQRKQTI